VEIQILPGDEEESRAVIGSWLRDYNWACNRPLMEAWEKPENEPQPLTIVAIVDGEVIGGVLGETNFSWLKIDILAVEPEHRRKGIGRQLVARAEKEGKVRGCRYAYVDSMSYQAAEMFPKLGYETVGVFKDWDSHGHDKHLFRKDLA